MKNILLVEPAYRSKFPPLGLMKIATYHKRLKKDKVVFVKGCSPNVRDEYWDRVYITTLFTYTWKETIKTINFYRETLFSFSRKIFVGGILASLMPDDVFEATGIQPIEGLLNNPTKIDQKDNIIIDDLPPDYEMLNQVDFDYSNKNAYIGYSTRGCRRNCEFCAVNTFEPEYIPYINIKKIISEINSQNGEKQNLLLMDNNVLFSEDFNKIIDDIKSAGFLRGAKIWKTKRKRVVDFNQGLDARLLTEEKMKKLAEIPLEPMRLAFDDIKYKDTYIKGVMLAHKFGQKNMSNYILYNYKDTPEDLYERLRINIELNEKFETEFKKGKAEKTKIYSFPMRYIPLDAKKRNVETGNPYWNKRYLRGVQVILSVIRGPVMTGKQFFLQAFGKNSEEFKSILLMPDDFIRNRLKSNWKDIKTYYDRLMPYVKEWRDMYFNLNEKDKEFLVKIISNNSLPEMADGYKFAQKIEIKNLLSFHLNAKDIVAEYANE